MRLFNFFSFKAPDFTRVVKEHFVVGLTFSSLYFLKTSQRGFKENSMNYKVKLTFLRKMVLKVKKAPFPITTKA